MSVLFEVDTRVKTDTAKVQTVFKAKKNRALLFVILTDRNPTDKAREKHTECMQSPMHSSIIRKHHQKSRMHGFRMTLFSVFSFYGGFSVSVFFAYGLPFYGVYVFFRKA
jgi:hypothetical protein